MKSILVPTDFSACASFALHTAAQLAQKFGSTLHLLTCLELPENWHQLPKKEQNKQAETMQTIQNAETLLSGLKAQYEHVDIQTSYSGGKLVSVIENYVADHGIEFVVMGSHGKSGKSEYFVGSNTQKVVRAVHCPVLVVKEKTDIEKLERVVFASHFHEDDKPAFLVFKDFVKHFIPEVHLVEIHTSSIFDPPIFLSKESMETFKALCAPLKCETHIYRDFTIEKGIRSFTEEIGASLVAVSNYHRHPLKRMLVGSNVEALVNHSNVPVLSIDYKIEES